MTFDEIRKFKPLKTPDPQRVAALVNYMKKNGPVEQYASSLIPILVNVQHGLIVLGAHRFYALKQMWPFYDEVSDMDVARDVSDIISEYEDTHKVSDGVYNHLRDVFAGTDVLKLYGIEIERFKEWNI